LAQPLFSSINAKNLRGLPVMTELKSPLPQAAMQQQLTILEGYNILVVEDDEDILTMLATILEQSGATVTAVGSALPALQALQAQPQSYALLLSDLGLPELDGWWLIRQVRALTAECGGKIPAIALTAYDTMQDRNISHWFGFQMLIAKPIEPTRLVADIAKFLEQPL
jgi:two-component system, chemotaxis family, CheB/CheR fusion protein